MNKETRQVIGRVNAALVAEDYGIIVPVMAECIGNNEKRILFNGNAVFPKSLQSHVKQDIIPILDKILTAFGLETPSFRISVETPAAITATAQSWTIEGNSIDLSVFLAMLSAALQLPIRQDIAYTGSISTVDGVISQVQSLSQKAQAAREEPAISGFCFPALDSDASLKKLTPKLHETLTGDIRACRGRIELFEIKHIADVIKKTLTPEARVIAALRSGYYDYKHDSSKASLIIEQLTSNLESAFWTALETSIIEKNTSQVHNLLDRYISYYHTKHKYPPGFGKQLNLLLKSLPGVILKTPGLMPLISKSDCDSLVTYAGTNDQHDIKILQKTIRKPLETASNKQDQEQTLCTSSKRAEILLNHLLEQIETVLFDSTLQIEFDTARERFYCEQNSVKNYDELMKLLERFYTHMLRHTKTVPDKLDENRLMSEGLNLVQNAFPGKESLNAMINDAKRGTNGGLKAILDAITDYLKESTQQKHILTTFKEALDPLDQVIKIELAHLFKEQHSALLPPEIINQPVEDIAENIEPILLTFIEAKMQLTHTFRRL